MTLFIIVCVLLTAAAMTLLVWPLLRTSEDAEGAPKRASIAAAIVAAGFPLVAFAIYVWASDWPWDTAQQVAQPSTAPDIQHMVTQLQQRLSQQPDDIEGWKLLGRSATVIGDYPAARDAFSQAYTRSQGQDPDAVVGYAESLLLNDEREIDGQAAELFEKAITMAPDNARALWYGGIVAYRRGEIALAQQRWVELQNHDLPPDLRQMVAERLSELEQQPNAPPPSSQPVAPVRALASISIQLAPALAAQVPPQATLFVIARHGEGGPPLAVVRRPVGTWPVAITMSDTDAMMAGTSLASAGPVRLIARISRAGQPTATSGDPYGEVGYDFATTNPVTVTIDRIVP
ncbi:MAG: tetratricopeptide repeat protein [Gammaproteobacteria bacterium]|nr:tetratricopeptide repeat protein [Gammaproteobacteria bacterium]